jgi:hypothetical protein
MRVNKVGDPEAVQEREYEERVLGTFSKCFGVFDQQLRSFRSRFCFRSRIPFDMG